jgi:hypothetical protein
MNYEKIYSDMEFGLNSEIEFLDYLNKTFDNQYDNYESNNKYAEFDFKRKDNNVFIELKSRRITSDKFKTVMLAKNKIDQSKKLLKKYPQSQIFHIFKFLDRTICIEYCDEDDWDSKYDYKMGGRNDRGSPERKPYYFIPKDDFFDIEDFELYIN